MKKLFFFWDGGGGVKFVSKFQKTQNFWKIVKFINIFDFFINVLFFNFFQFLKSLKLQLFLNSESFSTFSKFFDYEFFTILN